MADFNYIADSVTESAQFAVHKVQFGDGYTQESPKGINNGLKKWSVSFADRSLTEADAIRNFFVLKAGATRFTWRPQGYTADVKVICTNYSKPMQNRFISGTFVYTVTADFEERPL